MTAPQQAPGVSWLDVFPPPAQTLLTGVPAFLGYASQGHVARPVPLTLWPQFEDQFGLQPTAGYLHCAVRGFFDNGGLMCYVVRLDPSVTPLNALRAGLAALADVTAVDLVCAPDIMPAPNPAVAPDAAAIAAATGLQQEMLADCNRVGGRFAILDTVLTSDTSTVETQRTALASDDGAIYHPWLWVPAPAGSGQYVPPCGHVAGIYSRSDQETGVYKAPANEVVDGVLDLRVLLTEDDIGRLTAEGVNCLRAAPGRGIRVWGARSLSADPAWRPIAARRVFLTMGRWLEEFLPQLAFEPNDVRLWLRVTRELTAYLDGLLQGGALKGRTPAEAFFVKCDSETNPPDVTAAGMVVTKVGVALADPAEFIIVRIIHGASGVTIQPA
ncbi:MAG: phage tail sheath subtilisin-like domain-containing protein [Streptosporangiaceae bacterium]|jgi:phage tail sheath protein FI